MKTMVTNNVNDVHCDLILQVCMFYIIISHYLAKDNDLEFENNDNPVC